MFRSDARGSIVLTARWRRSGPQTWAGMLLRAQVVASVTGVVAGRCRIRLRKIIRTASVEQRRRSKPLHEGEISNYSMIWNNGAQERTRTFTTVKPLAPEASASTNSATWAGGA